MTSQEIQNILKNNRIRIGFLKAKVLAYIINHGYATAVDLDKKIGFSAGRRANDLKRDELLIVQKAELCQGIGERFYYGASPRLIDMTMSYKK